ncbi:MAG: hypothetical protein WC437_00730 [Patescibacteria group bacterium]|jgi:hypothetical protein|nr:hypothetical protein [Patescibacteria group bacterium]
MLSKKVIIVFLVSVFFAFLTFLYSRIDFSQIHSTLDIIKIGLPQLKVIIFNNDFFKQIPMLPVLLSWTIIGIIVYLIYYSVQLVYNNLRNWTVIEFFFHRAEVKEAFDIWHFSIRMVLHFAVLLLYTAFLVLLVFILYKCSAIFSLKLISGSFGNINIINFLLDGGMVFVIWIFFFSCFTGLLYLLNKVMTIEKLDEEHIVVS